MKTHSHSEQILSLLQQLYTPEDVEAAHKHIIEIVGKVSLPQQTGEDYFTERNITLITYGDTLQSPGEAPLMTLHHFLREYVKDFVSTVHILPFYPYSSDDGFSVTDYYHVNPNLGSWDDVQHIGADFRLMFDAVINHISAQSDWFKAFLANDTGYERLIITEHPAADLRGVTRPRTSPLLTPFQKADGSTVHVWTTFGADQVDLDYHSPDTLVRILEVLLFYVKKGAQVLRLDAIAYLWKEVGTSCIHLPQTHAVIRLIRTVLDVVAPHVILITETNVPHIENISYFGTPAAPEAQLVYNFTLPPLLFHTLNTGNATILRDWVNSLAAPGDRASFFNFTASHDGIGVRPLEGILQPEEIKALVAKVESSGGTVSYKSNRDGESSAYELNISYIDAIAAVNDPPDLQGRRFLVSQAIMLALAGIPAVYIHSLLGSRNDLEGMKQAGYPRAINRQKLRVSEVSENLLNPHSFRARIFNDYAHLIRTRRQSPCFHPKAGQRALDFNNGSVFALERTTIDNSQSVLCLFNLTRHPQTLSLEILRSVDLLSDEWLGGHVSLMPYQVRWLQNSNHNPS
jgi:glucosylglycerate phosphorylase